MRPAHRRHRRAGFTALEATIAVVLMGIVVFNLTWVLAATRQAYDAQEDVAALEVLATQTLDRIAQALVAANASGVVPSNSAPLHSSQITYEISLGVQDGEVVWSDPERIEHDEPAERVLWTRQPDTEQSATVVWGRNVAQWMEGETPDNLLDDNLNGLVDEFGLSFSIEGESVLIQLTLRRTGSGGREITTSVQTRVAFRN